jgi:hypothetical protein
MPKFRDQADERRAATIEACYLLVRKSGLNRTRGGQGILSSLVKILVHKHAETSANKGGKYLKVDRWTAGAFNEFRKNPNWRKEIHLDHVAVSRSLVSDLLSVKTRKQMATILARNQTCVLLRSEHRTITKEDRLRGFEQLGGWWRYAKFRLVPGPNSSAR